MVSLYAGVMCSITVASLIAHSIGGYNSPFNLGVTIAHSIKGGGVIIAHSIKGGGGYNSPFNQGGGGL